MEDVWDDKSDTYIKTSKGKYENKAINNCNKNCNIDVNEWCSMIK